ncbi:MAG: redox-regulated ATPase YchF [Candidatus Paceibacterota bacterium]|nr:redox-regulated ATPase YchF [Candidatus Paceibacterota bacterium]MDD4201490.1 redox-regulated ATPase YchF [Candidatus Paceibacterota bacterium]
MLSIGIVGLPNVGKSTFFKTVTKKQVDCANYPFCTIDPNVGVVIVPDERIDKLAELSKSEKKTYATVEFIDIAGLVKGASKGEGLGNKFLANIREVDAIIYVLRFFTKKDVLSVESEVNPLKEKEILDTELILKDIETIEKRIHSIKKEKTKEALRELETLEKAFALLNENNVLIEKTWTTEEENILKKYQLLTFKPRIYLLNGEEKELSEEIKESFRKNNWPFILVDILSEFETSEFTKEERVSLGMKENTEFDLIIKKSYEILGLISFLTTGKKETRAWTIKKGETAKSAAGKIHSDFSDKFIRADVIIYDDFLKFGSWQNAKEKGAIKTEGKEYIVKDGDIVEIKHG